MQKIIENKSIWKKNRQKCYLADFGLIVFKQM